MRRYGRGYALLATAAVALSAVFACSSPPPAPAGDDSNQEEQNQTTPTPTASTTASTTAPLPAPVTTATTVPGATIPSNGLPCAVSEALARNCQTCHGATAAATGRRQLVTFEDLSMMARTVEQKIHAPFGQQMPPTGPLNAVDMKTLDDWILGGAPRSDVACAAPVTTTPGIPTTPVPTTPVPTTTNPCSSNVQCVLGQVCRGGFCTPGCFDNSDCPQGVACNFGQCGGTGATQFPPQTGGGCVTNAQCPQQAPLCFQGQCFTVQQNGNGGFCVGNFCSF